MPEFDWIRWSPYLVIVLLAGIDGWQAYWLRRARMLIDLQTATLQKNVELMDGATQEISQLREKLRQVMSTKLGEMTEMDPASLSPEDRAQVRAALLREADRLKAMEN